MVRFTIKPEVDYDLTHQNEYFGSFPTLADGETLVLTFPVEDWQSSAAVTFHQTGSEIVIEVFSDIAAVEKAKSQALATLSLNIDGSEWPSVGERDKFIGKLQNRYKFLRPTLFSSPYEAAAHFIIGHRISMKQGRLIRAKIAETHGDKITVGSQQFAAFPLPGELLKMHDFPGLNNTKIERLHGIAEAALSGRLNRHHLLSISIEEAKNELLGINGIGPFFAEGILNRGAGIVDAVTDDDLTKFAIKTAYGLNDMPSQADVLRIAETWKPYRMWAEVLLHVWVRREVGLPTHRFANKKNS